MAEEILNSEEELCLVQLVSKLISWLIN